MNHGMQPKAKQMNKLPLLITLYSLAVFPGQQARAETNVTAWSESKHGIRVRLCQYEGFPADDVFVQLKPADESIQRVTSTNLYFLRSTPFIALTLRDADGKEVPKTAEGRKWKEIKKSVDCHISTDRTTLLLDLHGRNRFNSVLSLKLINVLSARKPDVMSWKRVSHS